MQRSTEPQGEKFFWADVRFSGCGSYGYYAVRLRLDFSGRYSGGNCAAVLMPAHAVA